MRVSVPASVCVIAPMAIAIAALFVAQPAPAQQLPPKSPSGKKVVAGAADLPQRTYHIPKKPSEMLSDATACKALAQLLEGDVRHDLATYTIQDRRDQSGLLEYAALTAFALGDYDTSLRYYEERKKYEDRVPDRLLSGLNVRASQAAARAPKAAQDAVYRRTYADLLKPLPHATMDPRIDRDRKQVADLSLPLLRHFAQEQLDPPGRNGAVDMHTAAAIVNYYVLLHEFLPRKAAIVGPMDDYLARKAGTGR